MGAIKKPTCVGFFYTKQKRFSALLLEQQRLEQQRLEQKLRQQQEQQRLEQKLQRLVFQQQE